MADRLMVAVPALNEAATIGGVLASIRTSLPDAHVVVVDDGSSDRTAEEARSAGAEVLVLPFNVGVGGAMRTAFLYADQKGYDAVVQIDADGQHDAAQVPALLEGLDSASVVIGARFAGAGEYPVRGPRRWAMRMLAATLSRISGTRLTDTTSGFRVADRKAIALFAQRYPAEYLGDTVESLVIASRAGLAVAQVPVVMRPRQGGEPSQSPIKSTLYLGRAGLALFVALTRRREAFNLE